jgi:protein-disulfide isomerase
MKPYLPFVIAGAAALTALATGPSLCQTIQPNRLSSAADETIAENDLAKPMHVRGNPKAPLTLEEFGDFECPSCKNVAMFLDKIVKQYQPSVRVIFRNFPLAMHQHARDAAVAAEAAGLQGRFWEMHDMLFREQAVWSSASDAGMLFDSYAETLGLDLNQFRKDLKSDKVSQRIESDRARASARAVKVTPTVFIDKHQVGTNEGTSEKVLRLIDEVVKGITSASEKK